jgi:hypothetical protein
MWATAAAIEKIEDKKYAESHVSVLVGVHLQPILYN